MLNIRSCTPSGLRFAQEATIGSHRKMAAKTGKTGEKNGLPPTGVAAQLFL